MEPQLKPHGGRVVFGFVLIAMGVASLLERAHIVENADGHWWPFVLLAIGISRLLEPGRRDGAWFWLVIGSWGLLVTCSSLTYSNTWPLLLVVWGGSMIVTSQWPRPLARHGTDLDVR